MPLSWINSYRKAIFSCTDGNAYGRPVGGSILAPFADSFAPLYFAPRDIKEVMPTEQPCDLAYEFGDGLFDVKELPQGFPKPGGSILAPFADSFAPLYFALRDVKEVMPTEQPCDLAYEFGDGLFDVKEFPQGFPKPGPGVCTGQAWQEGTKIEQVPRKLCSEILMVKDYRSL